MAWLACHSQAVLQFHGHVHGVALALACSRVFVSLGSVRLFVRVTGEEARIFSATWLRSRELDDAVSALPWDFDIENHLIGQQ